MDFLGKLPFLSRTAPLSPEVPPPPPSQPQPPQSAPAPTSQSSQQHSLFDARSRRQLTLFLAGSTFTLLSVLLSRRSLHKRRLAIYPSFYHPSNLPPRQSINSGFEAFEALSLATLNVASVSMMMIGGGLWAWDISSMEDLRVRVRTGIGVDGQNEEKAEEEFEEWIATVLERKEKKKKKRRERDRKGAGEDEEEEEEQ